MKRKLTNSNSVLVCNRFRFHRFVAAPAKIVSLFAIFQFVLYQEKFVKVTVKSVILFGEGRMISVPNIHSFISVIAPNITVFLCVTFISVSIFPIVLFNIIRF